MEREVEQVLTVDWDAEALWVQDRLMYVVERDDPADDMVTVVDQTGKQLLIERARLEQSHVPWRDRTVYKPRFRPVQAICPREAVHVEVDGATVHVSAGDALIRDSTGQVSVLPRHDFNCRYQFVAAASAQPPAY